MSEKAAVMQSYNSDLLKCLEELCTKREEVVRQIENEEVEKQQLQKNICSLSEKLQQVSQSLADRYKTRATFDRTIAETEVVYTKASDPPPSSPHKVLESTPCPLSSLNSDVATASKPAAESRKKEQ